jgi:hypothetical protein
MLQQQRVIIKPTQGGAIFKNEDGEECIKLGRSVMAEIGGILEMLADNGREAILLFEVEAGEETCFYCGEPVEPGTGRELDGDGSAVAHSDCGLPWS